MNINTTGFKYTITTLAKTLEEIINEYIDSKNKELKIKSNFKYTKEDAEELANYNNLVMIITNAQEQLPEKTPYKKYFTYNTLESISSEEHIKFKRDQFEKELEAPLNKLKVKYGNRENLETMLILNCEKYKDLNVAYEKTFNEWINQ